MAQQHVADDSCRSVMRLVAAGKTVTLSTKADPAAAGSACFISAGGLGAFGLGGHCDTSCKSPTSTHTATCLGYTEAASNPLSDEPSSSSSSCKGSEAGAGPAASVSRKPAAAVQPQSHPPAITAAMQPGGKVQVVVMSSHCQQGGMVLLLRKGGLLVASTAPENSSKEGLLVPSTAPENSSKGGLLVASTAPENSSNAASGLPQGRLGKGSADKQTQVAQVAECTHLWDVHPGDIIVAGSDGFFNALPQHKLLSLVQAAFLDCKDTKHRRFRSSTMLGRGFPCTGRRWSSSQPRSDNITSDVSGRSVIVDQTASEGSDLNIQVECAVELLVTAAAKRASSKWCRLCTAAAAAAHQPARLMPWECGASRCKSARKDATITCAVALVTDCPLWPESVPLASAVTADPMPAAAVHIAEAAAAAAAEQSDTANNHEAAAATGSSWLHNSTGLKPHVTRSASLDMVDAVEPCGNQEAAANKATLTPSVISAPAAVTVTTSSMVDELHKADVAETSILEYAAALNDMPANLISSHPATTAEAAMQDVNQRTAAAAAAEQPGAEHKQANTVAAVVLTNAYLNLLPPHWALPAARYAIHLQDQQGYPQNISSSSSNSCRSVKTSSSSSGSSSSSSRVPAVTGSSLAGLPTTGSRSSSAQSEVGLPKLKLRAVPTKPSHISTATSGSSSTGYCFNAPASGESPTHMQVARRQGQYASSRSRKTNGRSSSSQRPPRSAIAAPATLAGGAVRPQPGSTRTTNKQAQSSIPAAAAAAADVRSRPIEPERPVPESDVHTELVAAGVDHDGQQLYVGSRVAVVTDKGVAAVGAVKLLPGQKLDKWLEDKVWPEHVGVGSFTISSEMEPVARKAAFWVKCEAHGIYGSHPAYSFWSKRKVLIDKGGIIISVPCSSLRLLKQPHATCLD